MIERRQLDHKDLVQLGKTVLLLFRRQELLVNLPATTQVIDEIVPTKNSQSMLSGRRRVPNWLRFVDRLSAV
jgi:hypothetical protein